MCIRDRFDVVIVGYGPVGATLANLLGMHGHRVLVLEREAAMYHLPRAVHFDEEVMRVFQTIGLAHLIEKVVRVNPGMRLLTTADQPCWTGQGHLASDRLAGTPAIDFINPILSKFCAAVLSVMRM